MLADGTPVDPLDAERNAFPLFYWNWVGLEMNRVSTSLSGPQGGPTLGSRALGLLHLAMHDAWFTCRGLPRPSPYLPGLPTYAGADPQGLTAPELALSGAAITVLGNLYRGQVRSISRVSQEMIADALSVMVRDAPFRLDTLHAAYRHGEAIAAQVLGLLGIRPGEPGADQGSYEPRDGRYYFRDEPTHPVRTQPLDPDHPELGSRGARVYHGPFYGQTARTFAVTDEDALILKSPPRDDEPGQAAIYLAALDEVVQLGGAGDLPTTERSSGQTTAGIYWAYDGSNLIGTPPRLYNQIVRTIAWDNRDQTASREVTSDGFVRLFALCNAAMADAGKFAWREKYRFEFWRPLTGVREHHVDQENEWDVAEGALTTSPMADPMWRTLGAPDTNSNNIAFKPPFPAYPSGHATFGAACFQMLRRYYANPVEDLDPGGQTPGTHEEPDEIAFSFVSDEFNGASRHLYGPYERGKPITEQPGDVRTRMTRSFPSLKHAIFENAISRIFLGVHWRFDAFDDTIPESTIPAFPDPETVKYGGLGPDGHGLEGEMTGGVPLGIAIANQIFDAALTIPGPMASASAAKRLNDRMGSDPSFSTIEVPESKISNTNLR